MNKLFSNPTLKRAMKALATVFPNKSKNEKAHRAADLAAVRRGDMGDAVPHPDSLTSDGRLNRDKILCAVAVFYENEAFTKKDMQNISDAGFDVLFSGSRGEFRKMLLDECERLGIAAISADPSLPRSGRIKPALDSGEDLFSSYVKYPTHVGDGAWDEPGTDKYPIMEEYRKKYAEALPGQIIFYNLFPDGAGKRLKAKNYRDYVDRYAATVKTDYICLDIYPFYSFSAINFAEFTLCLNTYDCVSEACRREGIDFWIYIQVQCNWFARLYNFTTREQVFWQVYATLAYGARLIIHVAYAPVWGDEAVAMIDGEGNLTEQYLYSKEVNREVQLLSPVLSKYRSLGVLPSKAKHTKAGLKIAFARQKKASEQRGFKGIDCVKSVTSEGAALVGYFKSKDEDDTFALMIVNSRNIFDSAAAQKVTVTLTSPRKVSVWSRGIMISDGVATDTVTVDIDSCEGVFIEIKSV